jgi:hypothetical protein
VHVLGGVQDQLLYAASRVDRQALVSLASLVMPSVLVLLRIDHARCLLQTGLELPRKASRTEACALSVLALSILSERHLRARTAVSEAKPTGVSFGFANETECNCAQHFEAVVHGASPKRRGFPRLGEPGTPN